MVEEGEAELEEECTGVRKVRLGQNLRQKCMPLCGYRADHAASVTDEVRIIFESQSRDTKTRLLDLA